MSRTGFIPDEDQGLIFGFTEAQQGIAFQDMMGLQQQVADVITKDGYVMNTMSSVGSMGGLAGSINQGRVFFRLIDRKKRPHAIQVIQELRGKLAQIPGINVYLQIPPTIRIGGSLTKSQYQYTLQTPDTDVLYSA